MVLSVILPKHVKTREPEDEHCVLLCTNIYIYIYIYIYVCVCVCMCVCDTLPLDNPKTHSHLALLHITWGLIWDFKNKIQRDPN